MSRRFERVLIYIASIWQIITGSITAFIYLFNIESMVGASPQNSMFGMFIFIYGMYYVSIGIINIILVRKYIKENTIQKKIPVFLIILSVIFLILGDYISLTLLILAAVIGLAKNKTIEHGQMESIG